MQPDFVEKRLVEYYSGDVPGFVFGDLGAGGEGEDYSLQSLSAERDEHQLPGGYVQLVGYAVAEGASGLRGDVHRDFSEIHVVGNGHVVL